MTIRELVQALMLQQMGCSRDIDVVIVVEGPDDLEVYEKIAVAMTPNGKSLSLTVQLGE